MPKTPLSTPLFLRTKHIRVAAYPRFRFHETTTIIAPLASSIKKRASLACVVALFSYFARNLAMTNSLSACFNQSFSHFAQARLGVSLSAEGRRVS